MNPFAAIGFWAGWYWREQFESLGLLVQADKAKRLGDDAAREKLLASARAREGRICALLGALETFCHRHHIDIDLALGCAGVDRFKPGFDVPPDLDFQAAIERVLEALPNPGRTGKR